MPTFMHAGECAALDHRDSQHFLIPPAPPRTPLPSVEELWGKPSTRATTCCAQPPARPAWPLALPCGWMRPGGPQPATAKRKVNRPQSRLYCKLGLRGRQYTGHREEPRPRKGRGSRGAGARSRPKARGSRGGPWPKVWLGRKSEVKSLSRV